MSQCFIYEFRIFLCGTLVVRLSYIRFHFGHGTVKFRLGKSEFVSLLGYTHQSFKSLFPLPGFENGHQRISFTCRGIEIIAIRTGSHDERRILELRQFATTRSKHHRNKRSHQIFPGCFNGHFTGRIDRLFKSDTQ